jgi:hypothetical protein
MGGKGAQPDSGPATSAPGWGHRGKGSGQAPTGGALAGCLSAFFSKNASMN